MGENNKGRFVRILQFTNLNTTLICRRANIGKDRQATEEILMGLVSYYHITYWAYILITNRKSLERKRIFVSITRYFMGKGNGYV